MYNKILAPMDGSEFSECVLNHVKGVALGCNINSVILLTVIDMPHEVAYLGPEWRKDVEVATTKTAQEYLNGVSAKLKSEGINVETLIIHGKPADEILHYVEKNGVDLVIMSTHGRSGVVRWTLGSVAEKVLRHSPTAVMTIAPPACRTGK